MSIRRKFLSIVLGVVLVLGGTVAVPVSLVPGSTAEIGTLQQAEAASKAGTYEVEYHTRTADWYTASYWTSCRSTYKVKIKSIKRGKVKFYLERGSIRVGDPVRSKVITAKLKKSKASFSYKTGSGSPWPSKGKGSLVLGKNYVKVKVSTTWCHSLCRLDLSTSGHWLKIKKGTHKKWIN